MGNDKSIEKVLFRFRPTMLSVKELDRSIEFYTRLLGMEVLRRRINQENKKSVGYIGYGNEDHYPVLELVEDIGPDPPAKMAPWESFIHSGIRSLPAL